MKNVKVSKERVTENERLLRSLEKQIPTYTPGSSTLEVFVIGEDYLIQNELLLIRCSKSGKVKWYSDCHKDIILSVKIKGDKIDVKEFGGADQYSLDLETGRDKKTGKLSHHTVIQKAQ